MKIDKLKLQLAMANACLTIGQLAKQSKISRTSITNFISGKTSPKPATIGKLARALKVDVEDLIEDHEINEQ